MDQPAILTESYQHQYAYYYWKFYARTATNEGGIVTI